MGPDPSVHGLRRAQPEPHRWRRQPAAAAPPGGEAAGAGPVPHRADRPSLVIPDLLPRRNPGVTASVYRQDVARLSASDRAKLPDSAFAYIDSRGRRRLPIHDESHVRNALARFERVAFDDDAARERTRTRLLNA